MAGRNWCFTINNPIPEEYPEEAWTLTNLKTVVYQMEMGEEGTVHLQGYVELRTPRLLAWLKLHLNGRAHWEKRRGTRRQAVEYCVKEDSRLLPGKLWTSLKQSWEDIPPNVSDSWWNSMGLVLKTTDTGKSSNSSNLSEVQTKLSENSSSIEEVADEYFDLWVRYYRAFEKYVTLKTEPRSWETEVHVLFGPTGTGKSKWCMDNYPDAYWKQRSKWWDNYFKHETVIIDEFYGWLPFDLLLRLLDRYPMQVESKGGQLQFVARKICITTNKLPHSWYTDCYFPALARRVNTWHYLPYLGIHAEFSSYERFKEVIDERQLD
jgi:hypothetical protein